MGLFVSLAIDDQKCTLDGCLECVRACPLKVFSAEGGKLQTNASLEDECTFCGICIERCPRHALEIVKHY